MLSDWICNLMLAYTRSLMHDNEYLFKCFISFCDKTTVVKHQVSVLIIGYRTVSNYNTNLFTQLKNHNSKNIQSIVNAIDTNKFNSCIEALPHYRRLQTKKIRYQNCMFFYTYIVYLWLSFIIHIAFCKTPSMSIIWTPF